MRNNITVLNLEGSDSFLFFKKKFLQKVSFSQIEHYSFFKVYQYYYPKWMKCNYRSYGLEKICTYKNYDIKGFYVKETYGIRTCLLS